MVIEGEKTEDRHHFGAIALGVLLIAGFYGIGYGAFFDPGVVLLSRFELYSLAFFVGVWVTMLVTFGLNAAAHRLWGIDIVRFGPPRGT